MNDLVALFRKSLVGMSVASVPARKFKARHENRVRSHSRLLLTVPLSTVLSPFHTYEGTPAVREHPQLKSPREKLGLLSV
jgi:hypothetical protein